MNVTVNGTTTTAAGTLADLLAARLGDPRPPGVAVAVNHAVVSRSQWAAHQVREGDDIEIVTAVQGG